MGKEKRTSRKTFNLCDKIRQTSGRKIKWKDNNIGAIIIAPSAFLEA